MKWLDHGTAHLTRSSAEVKYGWSYTSTPLYIFMVQCSIKNRDVTFIFIYTERKPTETAFRVKIKSKCKVIPVL
jgi:hypothetical protein